MNRENTFFRGFLMLLLSTMLIQGKVLAQEFDLGVFGGVAVSQVDGDFYRGYHKLGMTAGVFVNREIDNNFYWQLELKYVSRGAFENDPQNYVYDKTVYRYIEIPLSVNYLFDEKYQVEAGISPEVLLQYAAFDANGKLDPRNYPDNRRFGLSVFAGFVYWFIPNTGVGFRFTYSAIPFREPQEYNNAQYPGLFHNVMAFTLAHKFKSRK